MSNSESAIKKEEKTKYLRIFLCAEEEKERKRQVDVITE